MDFRKRYVWARLILSLRIPAGGTQQWAASMTFGLNANEQNGRGEQNITKVMLPFKIRTIALPDFSMRRRVNSSKRNGGALEGKRRCQPREASAWIAGRFIFAPTLAINQQARTLPWEGLRAACKVFRLFWSSKCIPPDIVHANSTQ